MDSQDEVLRFCWTCSKNWRSPTRSARFAAPDDLILSKLPYHRMGESDKHLRDVAAMLQVSGDEIDRERVTREAERLGLSELWNVVLRWVEESRWLTRRIGLPPGDEPPRRRANSSLQAAPTLPPGSPAGSSPPFLRG